MRGSCLTLLVVTLPWIRQGDLALGFDDSGAESIASRARGARVIQAFNTMSATTIRHARRYRPKATVFIAGGDADAKRKVGRLASELGFDSVDAGSLKSARFTEPLAMLWAALVSVRSAVLLPVITAASLVPKMLTVITCVVPSTVATVMLSV